MTTTLKNWARGLNFNSSRAFDDKPSGFKAQGCISTRSWVIVLTDRQTNKQTPWFTHAHPLASLIAQPINVVQSRNTNICTLPPTGRLEEPNLRELGRWTHALQQHLGLPRTPVPTSTLLYGHFVARKLGSLPHSRVFVTSPSHVVCKHSLAQSRPFFMLIPRIIFFLSFWDAFKAE